MSDQNSVPVAVVGAGNMGANHIRVYDELPDAELVGVVEPDPDQAREIADQYRVPVVDRVADLEGSCRDSSSSNRLHREVAETCINEGMDVLVEKPLATTIEEAEAIVEVAAEAGPCFRSATSNGSTLRWKYSMRSSKRGDHRPRGPPSRAISRAPVGRECYFRPDDPRY